MTIDSSEVRLRKALKYIAPGAPAHVRKKEAAQIEGLYNSSGRFYHNLDHAINVANDAWIIGRHIGLAEPALKRIAAAGIYHDVIYVPGQENNESRSASFAQASLITMGRSGDFYMNVTHSIMATKKHFGLTAEERCVIDADLRILASESSFDYIEYTGKVRCEFIHASARQWVLGRMEWIDSMLERPSIYQTNYAFFRWEEKARNNLRAERNRLEKRLKLETMP